MHDPTTKNRQGNDVGDSDRSVIFFSNEEQGKIANELVEGINRSKVLPVKIMTEVVEAKILFSRRSKSKLRHVLFLKYLTRNM